MLVWNLNKLIVFVGSLRTGSEWRLSDFFDIIRLGVEITSNRSDLCLRKPSCIAPYVSKACYLSHHVKVQSRHDSRFKINENCWRQPEGVAFKELLGSLIADVSVVELGGCVLYYWSLSYTQDLRVSFCVFQIELCTTTSCWTFSIRYTLTQLYVSVSQESKQSFHVVFLPIQKITRGCV